MEYLIDLKIINLPLPWMLKRINKRLVCLNITINILLAFLQSTFSSPFHGVYIYRGKTDWQWNSPPLLTAVFLMMDLSMLQLRGWAKRSHSMQRWVSPIAVQIRFKHVILWTWRMMVVRSCYRCAAMKSATLIHEKCNQIRFAEVRPWRLPEWRKGLRGRESNLLNYCYCSMPFPGKELNISKLWSFLKQ